MVKSIRQSMSKLSMSKLWLRAKALAKQVRENGVTAVVGVLSFSLLFMLGLVTLGITLLAGVTAVIIAAWKQRQFKNDVANPTDHNINNEPIAAV
ncbi:hypothetical protein A1OO_10365 [Enterovibrio norvegicus FF-33]|uniref:Uncharacterized protein n=1 Tax=Enterovibrio norvegicus FF-454 TaxID=1185651 RepID=A0A1E5C7K1_9GAMM|nr:hypothetical protein [Enterovibrio norvegicus]OEE61488.1 hypothetical protein A1OK_09025 [Enterovibrio norvegicus FF-454]OEE66187.1 hypothetical protein A1OO_10365 [Enterovibrio norvegicus FF-33]